MATSQIAAHGAICNSIVTIPDMVSRYKSLVDQINAMPGNLEDGPEDKALWQEASHIDVQLASTPALTLQDLIAKVKWLRMPSNFNDGCLGAEYSNGKVLLSLFDDIERFAGS